MTTAAPDKPRIRPLHIGMALAAVAAAWGWLMLPAHYYWGAESYYNFGWFVPFLAAFFFYRKIRDARFQPADPPGRPRWIVFWAALGAALAGVTAARIIGEAVIVWRFPLWVHGLLLFGLSYLCLWLFAGMKGLRYFAFPFFFLLMALPWPVKMETWIIQSLTQLVTDLTVLAINLIGYPAAAMGNTIQVMDTHVGVDEACSGIRSLQALVMIALFFGEYLNFGLWRRIVLLAGAVFLSMAFNGARAIILTLVTVNGTEEKFAFWHDFLGNFNAIICGLLLFGLAELLDWLFGRSEPAEPRIYWRLWQPRRAAVALAAVAGGFLLSEAAVQGYYKWHEGRANPLPELVVEWPDSDDLWHTESEIPETTYNLLGCDYGTQMELQWAAGMEATAIYYGYRGEDKASALLGFFHSPKICMTGIGARLDLEKPPLEVTLNGIPWKVNHYEFVFEGEGKRQPMQVFWMIWDRQQMGSTMDNAITLDYASIFRFARDGRRDFRRQVILVYVPGNDTNGLIRERVGRLLDRIVVDR